MNLWILRGETPDKKGFEFLNAIRDHKPLILDMYQIRNFDAPDKLLLRGQVILQGDSVLYEPFHPKPAATGHAGARLTLFLDGFENSTLCHFTSPSFEPYKFCVKNIGQATVRDFRTTVLIPGAFRRPSSLSYIGDFTKQGETYLEDLPYVIYGSLIQSPIYKGEQLPIGQLILQADPGDYTFLWKIQCEDGVFPREDMYGRIQLRLTGFGDLMDQAVQSVHK